MLTRTLKHSLVTILALASAACYALVPLEGLLQGEVSSDAQSDPMSYVFQQQLSSDESAKALHKTYIAHAKEARGLVQSCEFIGKGEYASPSEEDRAKRSVVAALQYIGLDATVKAIGGYAKTLQMSEENYSKLVANLMMSSCSPNLSVYGHKLITLNLLASFNRPDIKLPTYPGQPFVANQLTEKNNALVSKEKEFQHTLQSFRALCSWGGDTQNYRMLPTLLANPLVMVTVLRHLDNKTLAWDAEFQQTHFYEGRGAVQVACQNLICRKVGQAEFLKTFPRVIGSSGVKQDLYRMWCHHFRDQEVVESERQHPRVREWLKKMELSHHRKMAGQMVALFTGVPDLMAFTDSYGTVKKDLRASIDERWDMWAKKALSGFSKNLLFEESLEIKVRPRRDVYLIRQNLFAVDLSVTMGELDRLLQTGDKLRLDVNLKLSRNWLRWLRVQSSVLNQKSDPGAIEDFMDQVANYLKPQLAGKAKYFPTPLFRDGLENVLAEELVEQVLRYQGDFFESYQDKMVTVPVRFHYGMFALSYMRYKAQIKARHKTLDL